MAVVWRLRKVSWKSTSIESAFSSLYCNFLLVWYGCKPHAQQKSKPCTALPWSMTGARGSRKSLEEDIDPAKWWPSKKQENEQLKPKPELSTLWRNLALPSKVYCTLVASFASAQNFIQHDKASSSWTVHLLGSTFCFTCQTFAQHPGLQDFARQQDQRIRIKGMFECTHLREWNPDKSNKDKVGFSKLHASLVENNTQTPDVTGKVVRPILDEVRESLADVLRIEEGTWNSCLSASQMYDSTSQTPQTNKQQKIMEKHIQYT